MTLQNSLESQLNDLNLNEKEKVISTSLIDSLDDSGQLIEEINEIENFLDYQFTYKEIESVLKNVIHSLDPAGVGFRTIKEVIFII